MRVAKNLSFEGVDGGYDALVAYFFAYILYNILIYNDNLLLFVLNNDPPIV